MWPTSRGFGRRSKHQIRRQSKSNPNLKSTIRNPKNKTEEIIEVVTRPQKIASHPYDKEILKGAHEHLILTNPESQNLVDSESMKRALSEKDYELSLLRVSNSHN